MQYLLGLNKIKNLEMELQFSIKSKLPIYISSCWLPSLQADVYLNF